MTNDITEGVQLKHQYRGKLIYAQSGTGKSTIADNVTVFDSDYLLGQILGVSTETAGFFFGQLSAKQKQVFGKQYRDLIRETVAQGYTVLTANASMLDDADVVVYNQSAEQTDKRVNSEDRAINNRYSALEYHENTLAQIKELKENETNKEYIELGEEDYLGHHLLSNPDSVIGTVDQNRQSDLGSDKQQVESGLTEKQLVDDFLNEFGIDVNHIAGYNGKMPLFEALSRTINARSPEEITDGVGYAIAFMMQGDPEMQNIIALSSGIDGNYDTKIRIPLVGKRSLKQLHGIPPVRDAAIRKVGRRITRELRAHFGEDFNTVNVTSRNKGIWNIIRNFFKKLASHIKFTNNIVNKRQERIDLFVQDVIEALGREDFSRIRGPLVKPGTTEKAERVDIPQALKDNPYENEIIKLLNEHNIALAGSASIAIEGSLFRPKENPLHDLDFNAGNNSKKETLDKLLPEIFGKDRVAYASMIHQPFSKNATVTYVTFDRPFTVKNNRKFTAEYYDLDGNLIGRRVFKGGVELELEPGVHGKVLDFFTGPTQESNHGFHKVNIDGTDYLFSKSNAAMAAKILWARPKDMWDYKLFIRDSAEEYSELSDNQRVSLKRKETWKTRASNVTSRMLSYDKAQRVNRLLETYMNKAGEGITHVSLVDEFFKGKSLTATQALDQIIATTTDKVTARLAQQAKRKLGKAADTLIEYKDKESGNRGQFFQEPGKKGYIHIYENATTGTDEQSARLSMQRTILHEIIHAITADAIESSPRLQKEIASIMREVQNYVDTNNLVPNLYALKNEKEFVAEFLSRPEFREALKLMPTDQTKPNNIFRKVLNWIKKVLGINTRTTLYSQADKVIRDILDNQAIEYYEADLAEENNQFDSEWSRDHLMHFINGTGYYVDNGVIYNDRAEQVTLPEKLRNQILVTDGLANGTAIEVEHHGNKYVVLDDDRIISLQKTSKYKTMQWDERNGDRRTILANARPTFNSQRTSSPSNNVQSEKRNTFTFSNGITVNAPFQPNPEQVTALNAMADFVDNPDKKVMTLSGYAGTGKTSLMEMFADMMKKRRKPVLFSASTNKAAGELGKRVNKKGYKAKTLNKIFGIAVENDSTKAYDTRNLISKIHDNKLVHYGDTVIIDEASMINELNYDTIMNIAAEFDLKIIFVGDNGQLAPVKEKDVSKVFRDKGIDVVTLYKVERTGDNAILKEATRSRDGENFSYKSSFNNRGQGVAFISDKHKKNVNAVIDHFAKGLKDNPDYFRILAYTNAAVARYNEYVRHLFGYDDAIPRVGEPMMGYTNWGYNYGEYRLVNSESYKVTAVGSPVTITRKLVGVSGYLNITVEAIPITLEDSAGKVDTYNLIDVKRNDQNKDVTARLAEEKDKLWKVANRLHGHKKGEVIRKINAIEDFLFVNDEIKSSDGRRLQDKVIDFGYAMTTHKSQGSTFTHVLIDDVDIAKASLTDNTDNADNMIPVPDISPDEYEPDMSKSEQIGEGEAVDIDWGEPIKAETNKAKEYGNISTRQRLEYVAVSRATDTATIISDMVKESDEDSPLNHIGIHDEPVMNDAMTRSIELINAYYQIQKENYSATDFTLSKLAPQERHEGDYSHAGVISKDVRSLINDYLNTMFKDVDGNPKMTIEEINSKQYGNVGQKQKSEILAELERLKNYFNDIYGEGQYLITTKPIRTTGTFNYNGTKASVAGMTDVILVDKDGGIHLYNTRVKTFDASDTANNGMAGIEFIQNGVRQLLEEGIGTKIEDVNLIWFNQKYPDQTYPGHVTGVTYTTDRTTGEVRVTDVSEGIDDIPLSEYSRWETPHLAERVSDAIIPVARRNVLNESSAINQTQQRFADNNTTLTNNQNNYTDEFRRIQEESSRMAQGTLSEFNRGTRELTKNDKQRLGGVYERLLSRNSDRSHSSRSLTSTKYGTTFNVM